MNESEKYLANGIFFRAYPERLTALLVTLVVEIPVLFMISGGSDKLCSLIGRRRYQLMMAFLPLSSAISGNCGLQSSTLTTRAISHLHVTRGSYRRWLLSELGAAFHLGLSMGAVLGIIAYYAGGLDAAFGFTIAASQFVSVLTAGLTGTLAPLVFTFIFHRDSGKWAGPLETAIQDIVGSFAMVVMSYHLLLWLGPAEVSTEDYCGGLS
uniref:SLC41A/MgtE integral membrane domain-containing protein n=1 Tax=Pseudictyota dubia TaxID=2749911 RepID=A0A7R9VGZ5_9STRA